MKIFTRETLKRSLKPIIIVLMVCAFVWYWGNYRKVSVDLTMRTEITDAQNPGDIPKHLDLTIYNQNQKVATTINQPLSQFGVASQHISLPTGTYHARGIVTMASGQTHIVEQMLVVPEDSAIIDIYLRNQ